MLLAWACGVQLIIHPPVIRHESGPITPQTWLHLDSCCTGCIYMLLPLCSSSSALPDMIHPQCAQPKHTRAPSTQPGTQTNTTNTTFPPITLTQHHEVDIGGQQPAGHTWACLPCCHSVLLVHGGLGGLDLNHPGALAHHGSSLGCGWGRHAC